jgi:uncharacterized damage-inducible protein DinB
MLLPEYFANLYDYNHWANQRVLDAAESLNEEQLFQELGKSWGSVHHTLVHMMNAEWIWLERWKGTSPREWLPFDDFPSVDAIRSYWAGITRDLLSFVEKLTPESLRLTLSYTNSRGIAHQAPLWLLMGHLVNHGTHHRGELTAMFALLEVPHKENDFYYYYLINAGQMED